MADTPVVTQNSSFWVKVQYGKCTAACSKVSGRITVLCEDKQWDDVETALKFLAEQMKEPEVIDADS